MKLLIQLKNRSLVLHPILIVSHLRSHAVHVMKWRSFHSKLFNTRDGHMLSDAILSVKVVTNVMSKRHINFERLRQIYRIIRLKDRGIEHNFKHDRQNPKEEIIVYKSEINRITFLGGIVFPLLAIITSLALYIWPQINRDTIEIPIDPHDKRLGPKYAKEIVILVSCWHLSLSRKYVLRMYYNRSRNVFKLSTWNWYFPFTTSTRECPAGSGQYSTHRFSDSPFYHTFFGNCKVKGRSYYINENQFAFPVYYNILFGYSTPRSLPSLGKSIEEINKTNGNILQRKRDI
ncbi:uncharacterized protein LOC128962457 [Oppia nitens]|uniref:uncharacterized protein LOC128962457 n=1 Tax=Oppia nitens TaxID=1686743 RepID=UPI0023DB59FC|nr:uncharacterized protein LOC128962457 [Oppia nitens]